MIRKSKITGLVAVVLFVTALFLACRSHTMRAFPAGNGYYVAPDGDDGNPGSLDKPWQTIQKAADTLAPGDTVYVREGVYNESVTINVSGSEEDGDITFQNYPGETPILDGNGLVVPDDYAGLFRIIDQNYIIIQGFELRDYQTAVSHRVPTGIVIAGTSHHIELRENHIHDIASTAPLDEELLGADAHGIAVLGTVAPQAIHNIIIDGNELYDLTLGSSEALVLNGNVRDFTVSNNIVRDSDNIGIDFIGFEGTAPDPDYDRARNGRVTGNTIFNIDTIGNPSYGGERSAGGIYVDGGTHIIIERNRVFAANIGIEIASEHQGRETSLVTVRNNFLYHNHITGIAMGGYDSERGSTVDCVIANNTLYHNDTGQDGNGEILVQFDTRRNIIKNNIVFANDQSLLIANYFTQNSDNVVDYNVYFAPAGAADSEWQWQDVYYQGFEAYRTGTGNDAHSLFAAPQLVDGTAPDLHLQSTSPAINKGENLAQAGLYDIDGDARIQDGVIDIGADEYGPGYGAFIYLPLVSHRG